MTWSPLVAWSLDTVSTQQVDGHIITLDLCMIKNQLHIPKTGCLDEFHHLYHPHFAYIWCHLPVHVGIVQEFFLSQFLWILAVHVNALALADTTFLFHVQCCSSCLDIGGGTLQQPRALSSIWRVPWNSWRQSTATRVQRVCVGQLAWYSRSV